MREKSFLIHRENGFAMNLPNGIRISTIWGWGSHSETRNYKDNCPDFQEKFERVKDGSMTVEIMVSCPDKKWQKKFDKKYSNGDTVIDNVDIDKWFKILKECFSYKLTK